MGRGATLAFFAVSMAAALFPLATHAEIRRLGRPRDRRETLAG